MDEVFTHPQTDITNHLVHLSDNHANGLRCHLYANVIKFAASELKDDFLHLGIALEDFDTLDSRLCNRYKPTALYDDIYMLGISLIEKSLHKDFKKLLTQAPAKKKAAKTTDASVPSVPQINSCEKTLITALTEIKSIVTAIRQENKDLKAKIDLLTTKVDQQNREILSLKNGTRNSASANMQPPITNTSVVNNGQLPPPMQQPQHINRQQEQQQQLVPPLHLQQPQQQQAQQEQPPQNYQQQQSAQNSGQQHPPTNHQRRSPGTNAQQNLSGQNSVSDDSRQNPLLRFGSIIQSVKCPAGYRNNCVNKTTCFYRHIGEKVGDAVPKGEWTLVTSNRRKPPLFGSKRATNATIAGQRTVRQFSIFVGGVHKELSIEDFTKHVKDNLGVSAISVVQNRCNEYNQSFKLTICSTDKNKIFNPEMWDENIVIKPFRERRNPGNWSQDMSAFRNVTPL